MHNESRPDFHSALEANVTEEKLGSPAIDVLILGQSSGDVRGSATMNGDRG